MSTAIFNGIAGRYDIVNQVLSFGMDKGWRKKVCRYLPQGESLKVLDLATGTGELAIALGRDGRIVEVIGMDLAEDMLKIARKKVLCEGLADKVSLLNGDALALPFPDGAFDSVTVAFGVRNYSDLMKGLLEARRVLKANGRLIILEFSQPRSALLKYLHALYLRYALPLAGALMTGRSEAYRHLSQTALAFPYGDRFIKIIRQVGFRTVGATALAMGAATIYVAHMRD